MCHAIKYINEQNDDLYPKVVYLFRNYLLQLKAVCHDFLLSLDVNL